MNLHLAQILLTLAHTNDRIRQAFGAELLINKSRERWIASGTVPHIPRRLQVVSRRR